MKGYIEERGERSVRITVYKGKDPKTGQKKPPYHETIERRTLAKAQKAAQVRLNHILDEMNQGTWVEPIKMTFGEFLIGKWLPCIKPPRPEPGVFNPPNPGITQATYDMYEYLCRCHIVPELGHIPLQKLSPADLDAFYADRLKAPKKDRSKTPKTNSKGTLSPATVRHMHDVIGIALGRAYKWGNVFRNVAELATPPSLPEPRDVTWEADEAVCFLEAMKAEGDPYYSAFLLAIAAGSRRGEIFGLRWTDIDWVNRVARPRQSLVKTSVGNMLKGGKTKQSKKPIALSEATVEALHVHRIAQVRARRAFEAACGPGSYDDGDLVFAREDGHFLDPNAFGRYFKRRVERLGLTPLRVHDLRHTAATLMSNAGVDIKAVSNQLRHKRISTSEGYVGPIPDAQRAAAEKMDDVLKLGDRAKKDTYPIDPQNMIQ